jgi:hypothetical protein
MDPDGNNLFNFLAESSYRFPISYYLLNLSLFHYHAKLWRDIH